MEKLELFSQSRFRRLRRFRRFWGRADPGPPRAASSPGNLLRECWLKPFPFASRGNRYFRAPLETLGVFGRSARDGLFPLPVEEKAIPGPHGRAELCLFRLPVAEKSSKHSWQRAFSSTNTGNRQKNMLEHIQPEQATCPICPICPPSKPPESPESL